VQFARSRIHIWLGHSFIDLDCPTFWFTWCSVSGGALCRCGEKTGAKEPRGFGLTISGWNSRDLISEYKLDISYVIGYKSQYNSFISLTQ